MPWLSDLKHALQKLGEPEKPRAERRPATGITALLGSGLPLKPAEIKDISYTGIFLYTEERPSIDEFMSLVLRADSDPEKSAELQFFVQARVTTHGEDGIGLSFVLPPGMEQSLWMVLLRNIVELADPFQVAETFRNLRMILFVCRLCQADAVDAINLLGGQLDGEHTATLFRIAFAAEQQLATDPEAGRMRAHPKIVASILREGTWAPDELIQGFWTGLLVSTCSVDEPDDTNQIFVDLLIHMTHTEGKIFNHACKRALGGTPGMESSATNSIILSPREMVQVTGVHDLYRNATDLAYLFNLGLVQNLFDFTSYHEADSYDITPTKLGLALYQHCHGSREKVGLEIVESAKKHLANFLPPVQPTSVNGSTPSPAVLPSGR